MHSCFKTAKKRSRMWRLGLGRCGKREMRVENLGDSVEEREWRGSETAGRYGRVLRRKGNVMGLEHRRGDRLDGWLVEPGRLLRIFLVLGGVNMHSLDRSASDRT